MKLFTRILSPVGFSVVVKTTRSFVHVIDLSPLNGFALQTCQNLCKFGKINVRDMIFSTRPAERFRQGTSQKRLADAFETQNLSLK